VGDRIHPLTKKLGARVILLPFFGEGALKARPEMDYVGDFLKEIGPEAERSGSFSAWKTRFLRGQRAHSRPRAVESRPGLLRRGQFLQQWFRHLPGNPLARKDRICEFHLKDNPHLLARED